MSAVAFKAKPKPKTHQETEIGLNDSRPKTIFEAVARYGEDGDFKPIATPGAKKNFVPTDAPPGSDEKIDVLRQRLEKGLPLWHKRDRKDYVQSEAKEMHLLFAQAVQIATRCSSESFDDLEQDGVCEFDVGDAPERARERCFEGDSDNPASEQAPSQHFSTQEFPELKKSRSSLGANGLYERTTGRGKNKRRGPNVVGHHRDFKLIEQLARRALEKKLSSQRGRLNKDIGGESALRQARLRQYPLVDTHPSADPFSSLAMPPKVSEGTKPHADVSIQRCEGQSTSIESGGFRLREPSPPPPPAFNVEPIQAAHLEVLRVYQALKEAVALNTILPTELARFQEQHLELLKKVAPQEVA